MFFTVWGSGRAGLDRALLDGSERKFLVTTKIVYPNGITLDLPTRQIYWVDKFLDSVERVDYNGNNRRTIYKGVSYSENLNVEMHSNVKMTHFCLTGNYVLN